MLFTTLLYPFHLLADFWHCPHLPPVCSAPSVLLHPNISTQDEMA
jgi:hypothetical protein